MRALGGHPVPGLLSSFARGGQVAQLVEHRTENPGVGGSIPSLPTIFLSSTCPAFPLN